MDKTIPSDVFKKELLDLLDETFEKTQGIYLDRGNALFDTLESITAAQASQPIGTQGATIAGHVEHMGFYLNVLTDCILRKPETKIHWEDSWQLRGVDESEWGAAKQRLRIKYQETRTVMAKLEEWKGEDDIGASLAILAHTAMHLGAIRQALHVITR